VNYLAHKEKFKTMLTNSMKEHLGEYEYIIEEDDFGLTDLGIKTKDGRKYYVSNVYNNIGTSDWLKYANYILIDKINEDMNAKKED
jgi:hypothetical protein